MPTPAERLVERALAWGVAVASVRETPSSLVAFGHRGDEPVVLKIVRRPGDEWSAGEVLAAFAGRGMARVLAHEPGAMLVEWLRPGTPLVEWSPAGRDDEATAVLADVVAAMPAVRPTHPCPTVHDWGRGFARHLARRDSRVPVALVRQAARVYARLADTQGVPRLLHGDLQHHNVLLDERRGWLAIDPKGIVGELEFEIGAAMRNPWGRAARFADPVVIARRMACFVARLPIDGERTLAWTFAQAVLSAVWQVEDGEEGNDFPTLRLAEAVWPMLDPGTRAGA